MKITNNETITCERTKRIRMERKGMEWKDVSFKRTYRGQIQHVCKFTPHHHPPRLPNSLRNSMTKNITINYTVFRRICISMRLFMPYQVRTRYYCISLARFVCVRECWREWLCSIYIIKLKSDSSSALKCLRQENSSASFNHLSQ